MDNRKTSFPCQLCCAVFCTVKLPRVFLFPFRKLDLALIIPKDIHSLWITTHHNVHYTSAYAFSFLCFVLLLLMLVIKWLQKSITTFWTLCMISFYIHFFSSRDRYEMRYILLPFLLLLAFTRDMSTFKMAFPAKYKIWTLCIV